MPPTTAAEKQKKYRDKLKKENPQKYEEIQKKAKERSARYYEKKKSTYTEEHKQELRNKWKEDRKKAKDAKMASQNEPGTAHTSNSKQDNNQLTCRNMQRRIEYRLKQETAQLRLQLNTLTKGFKSLQKKTNRQQKKIDKMQADYENLLTRLITTDETKDTYTRELEEKTPRKEVTEFINNNIPNIETPKKEEVKKKLLEHDVLTKSLKLQFQTVAHTPVAHSFLPTIYANEKHTSNKQETCEKKKEVKNSKNSNKAGRRRFSSSTEEDEYDDSIEYAESDASAFFSDESISPDFNDDENNLITELDEKTGVLRPKINPNKKVTLLSTIILKKPNAENNPKHERKRKIICENEDLIHKRFCETTKHVTGKDDVTILSQIRKNPENTASYDLRESYLFGKEDPIKEIRSNKIETDKRKIDQNRENKNDTKEEIKKSLKEKFLIEEKHKIEIECTKKDESKEILIVIAEEERKEADENKENYTIETEYKKQLESMRGQNNTGEVLQDADKYKQMEKTDLDKTNKSENLKEDASDKESNTKEEGKKAIESEENTQNFILNINDSIIVRYFQRKTWKYFIGFVENIEFKNGENYYKVKFLKTVKDLSDSVKFVVQRKSDIDIVTNISIVKKVNLIQREKASKEYYLSTDIDLVYFNC